MIDSFFNMFDKICLWRRLDLVLELLVSLDGHGGLVEAVFQEDVADAAQIHNLLLQVINCTFLVMYGALALKMVVGHLRQMRALLLL